MITYDQFLAIDIRVGTVVMVEDFPEARTPAYKITIDFGPEIGIKRSSSQIATCYAREELIGRQVMGVVNFPPKQVGPFMSEVLTLGFKDEASNIVLAIPDKIVPNGERLL
jgi:tRNA-binding protein